MAMQYLLGANGFLTGVYDGPVIQPNGTTVLPTYVPDMTPQFQKEKGAWVNQNALPLLTPMTLYMAFTPAERIAIKASKDPMVAEFWSMYQLSVQLDKPTDPNLASVRDILAYLAKPASPGPGGGILSSPERVQQILAGIPQ